MLAIALLALAASFVAFVQPERAWAAPDFYAVLFDDGTLVFQKQQCDIDSVVNYDGSCAGYTSGKAPWLEKANKIKSVRFDESFASIKPQSLAFWFIGCENLQTIDLQNLDASESTSMRSMFSGCKSLTTIEHLDSFDTSSSTYFGSMFRDCSSLTSLDISHFDATHVGVLCFMFAGCTNLETLNMAGEGWRTESLYLMVHVWEDCSSLKSLDLSYLDTSGVHSMAKDFNGCSSLEYLDLSGADTSGVGSLDNMFTGCGKLATVKLGSKFTFNGMSSSPQCHLPDGMWKSEATGTVYAAVDVPNNTADTYTRVPDGGGDDPGTDPGDDPYAWSDEPGEYSLPNLKSSLGMFNHFVAGSQKLTVTDSKVTLSFTTDGSITVIRGITKVAIGPSSQLCNKDDMAEGETKYTNSLLGDPVIFEGTLVSAEGEPSQYAYELEFDRAEFKQMIEEDGGIYLTLFYSAKNAWHMGTNDLLITLGEPGSGGGGGSEEPEQRESIFADLDDALVDGTYPLELMVVPSMVKLSGHGGLAPEPKLVVSGDDAWLVVSYRSSLGSAWRYSQMAWGSYEEVVASGMDGVGGAPIFKDGKSAADGMGDATLDAMVFALPISKAEFIAWATSGESREFTVRYVKGYSGEHDGDWWKASSQPVMMVADVYAAEEPSDVPADYAAVIDALADVPENLDAYTEESVQGLTETLESIAGEPLSASHQADVDAMAAEISEAIDALEPKVDEPTYKPGWNKIDGDWYFFNDDGTMAKSTWKKDSKGWCYLDADGKWAKSAFAKDSKGWCWIGSSGYMVTSTKWIKVDGIWYHITKGYMDVSKWMRDSKGWCYLGPDGKMVTNGWAKDSKGWCWMGADGYWVANKWVKDGDAWYYIKSNHYMAKSEWVKSGSYWYYLQANGKMATGTITIGSKTYNFDDKGHWIP